MRRPTVRRGGTITGTISLKQIVPAGSGNQFPYAIPNGAVVEIYWPPDTEASTPVTQVKLSSATALPNPPFSANEVVINNARDGVTFTMTPAKSDQLLVNINLAVDLWVVKDPTTRQNIDVFEKVRAIDVVQPANT